MSEEGLYSPPIPKESLYSRILESERARGVKKYPPPSTTLKETKEILNPIKELYNITFAKSRNINIPYRLNEYINMTEDQYNKWTDKQSDNIKSSFGEQKFPYQNRDMKKNKYVRYAKVSDIEKLFKNQYDLEEIFKDYKYFGIKRLKDYEEHKDGEPVCNFAVPSIIDLHKMKRTDKNSEHDYKYLYQINTQKDENGNPINEAVNILKTLDKTINEICDKKKIMKIFVPYLPENKNKDIDIKKHPSYDLYITNDEKFVQRLKKFPEIAGKPSTVGRIISELDYIFKRYDKFDQLSKEFDQPVVEDMYKIEMSRRRGINKDQLAHIVSKKADLYPRPIYSCAYASSK